MRENHSELHSKTQGQLHKVRTAKTTARKSASRQPIDWCEWNPFERATGDALKQLNQRQRKQTELDGEEALL
jgi:hypothetical protein